jgi:hypothetical protein
MDRDLTEGADGERGAARAAIVAFAWAVAFTALHVYWYLGGRVGFGDQPDPLPPAPSSAADWVFTIVVAVMFAGGLVVPLALARPWGRRLPQRLLVGLMWVGCVVLVIRGGVGLLDDVLRFTGLRADGLTGLSTAEVLGSAHPSTSTKASAAAIDSVFLLGGVLFGRAAGRAGVNNRTG